MKRMQSFDEVNLIVNMIKANASAYCTNFFPVPSKLQGWIDHGEILCEQGEDIALFLRKDRDLWHLYFCAASPMPLQRVIAEFPMSKTDPVVVDLVGKVTELGSLVDIFESAGFRRYQRLLRMARTVMPTAPTAAVPDIRVINASKEDCRPVLELLLRSFDLRAEQIPMPFEIEAAVEAGQILIAHNASTLAGFLFFETQGLTSILRYWLIAAEFRSQGFGSGLMHKYFADNHNVRRFLLWVISNNTDAIDKYQHYGYAPDGLVDYVLANERISP